MIRPATEGPVLVFFALAEECRFYRPGPGIQVAVTGMGAANARRRAQAELDRARPALVLTCGYAGGLRPDLELAQVVYDATDAPGLVPALEACGAIAGRFYCAERVAVTAAQKRALRQASGADAVEMESGVIRDLCRARGIAAATVRVVSDGAGEDLPMDFNEVADSRQNLSWLKLAGRLAREPGLVPVLLRFRRRMEKAARALAGRLEQTLGTGRA